MKKFTAFLIVSHLLVLQEASARPVLEEESADLHGNSGGGASTQTGDRVMQTNLIQHDDDLLEQGDAGFVPSDSAPADPPASTMVNPHLPQSNASFGLKNSIGTSLKSIQQLLKKYFIFPQGIPSWWKQISDSPVLPSGQANKS